MKPDEALSIAVKSLEGASGNLKGYPLSANPYRRAAAVLARLRPYLDASRKHFRDGMNYAALRDAYDAIVEPVETEKEPG